MQVENGVRVQRVLEVGGGGLWLVFVSGSLGEGPKSHAPATGSVAIWATWKDFHFNELPCIRSAWDLGRVDVM